MHSVIHDRSGVSAATKIQTADDDAADQIQPENHG